MTDLRSAAPGEYGGLRLVSAEITYEDAPADDSGTVDLEPLAAGDVVVSAWVEVTEVFDAGTTNSIDVGDGTTADKFVDTTDVTETSTGVYPAGSNGPFAAEAAAGTLTATYTQAGTAATQGAARVYALVTSAPA